MGKKSCNVLAEFGDLGTKKDRHGNPVTVRLSKVEWYDRPATYDIRGWSPDGDPDKGISLSIEMLKTLKDILDSVTL